MLSEHAACSAEYTRASRQAAGELKWTTDGSDLEKREVLQGAKGKAGSGERRRGALELSVDILSPNQRTISRLNSGRVGATF